MTKAIRRQAVTAERVATQTANTLVAVQMKDLAEEAFRAQVLEHLLPVARQVLTEHYGGFNAVISDQVKQRLLALDLG